MTPMPAGPFHAGSHDGSFGNPAGFAHPAAKWEDNAVIPVLDIDPFCQAFFDDPYSAHAAMRDAGPVVYLPAYDIHAGARYEDVRAMLLDWGRFARASGVGISDFAKEKPWRLPSLLLETDPPLHHRTRALMDKVLSPAAVRGLREWV